MEQYTLDGSRSENFSEFESAETSNMPLKYQRREKRTIDKNTYSLAEPSETTSNIMRMVPISNTSIELIMEQELKLRHFNYTKPSQVIEPIAGNPDFVLPRYRIAIFCDGAFWHGYNFAENKIKNNGKFWSAKIKSNIQRDANVNNQLREKDWMVFRFWEHEIKNDVSGCVDKIQKYIADSSCSYQPKFTFVDLFSGIGGFRVALEELGGQCLGFSEIDKPATEVYKTNFFGFNDEEKELGDITKLGKLPFEDIDLVVGGVPCQSWSVAGKMRGFEDPRGRLWHDSIRVIEENRPKAFIFENVKGLIDPRNKANLNLIVSSLEGVGYQVKFSLLNSYDFGLPQNRERIFLVGIRNDRLSKIKPFKFPDPIDVKASLTDIIEDLRGNTVLRKKEFSPSELFGEKIPVARNKFQKLTELNDFFVFCDTRNGHTTIHSWDLIKTSEREKEICMTILRNRRKKLYGESDGNPLSFATLKSLMPDLKEPELVKLVKKKILRIVEGKGYEFVNSKNSAGINGIYRVYLPHSHVFSTLTATGTKDMLALCSVNGDSPEEYKKNFIESIIKKKLFRPITAKESGRLQGFPKWFSIHKDESLAKKQFGNAVSTSVIYHLGRSLLETGIFT